jgi:porphobilinogen synthase
MSGFPQRRPRRLRRTARLRRMVRRITLDPRDCILPLFVVENPADSGPIAAMPGVCRWSLDELPAAVEQACAADVGALLVFGIPREKTPDAATARSPDGIAAEAIRCVRACAADAVIIGDVCVCSFTDHGHCGIVHDGVVDNDATLALLAESAVAQARAGADLVAPSAMMDGQVAAIRRALDHANRADTGILSYAVKFASAFYGPFREAADCAPAFGDRRTYQMDPANREEALLEAAQDVAEGADALMVKPGLPYLDVISAVRAAHPGIPLAAYQVSGEYAQIAAAAVRGWLDERQVALEALTALKRAGADLIITYYADRVADWLA